MFNTTASKSKELQEQFNRDFRDPFAAQGDVTPGQNTQGSALTEQEKGRFLEDFTACSTHAAYDQSTAAVLEKLIHSKKDYCTHDELFFHDLTANSLNKTRATAKRLAQFFLHVEELSSAEIAAGAPQTALRILREARIMLGEHPLLDALEALALFEAGDVCTAADKYADSKRTPGVRIPRSIRSLLEKTQAHYETAMGLETLQSEPSVALSHLENSLRLAPENNDAATLLDELRRQGRFHEEAERLRSQYTIRQVPFNPGLRIYSPRVAAAGYDDQVYLFDAGNFHIPQRLLLLHLDTPDQDRMLSKERFYSGLWVDHANERIYGALPYTNRAWCSCLDVLDLGGRLIRRVDVSSPAFGSVVMPFRMIGDGDSLYLIDGRTNQVLHYRLPSLQLERMISLTGWFALGDISIHRGRMLLTSPAQGVVLSVDLASEEIAPVEEIVLPYPQRLATDVDSGDLYAASRSALHAFTPTLRHRFARGLEYDTVRNIALVSCKGQRGLMVLSDDAAVELFALAP